MDNATKAKYSRAAVCDASDRSLSGHNLQRRLSMRRKQPGEHVRRETLWEPTYQLQPPREVRRRRRRAEFTYLGELPGLEGTVRNQRHRIPGDRKSTRLNSSHLVISYAVFCLKKKKRRQ